MAGPERIVTLNALGLADDPGTDWHPDKPLGDLDDAAMAEHLTKPEHAAEREAGPLAAEDSTETAGDVV